MGTLPPDGRKAPCPLTRHALRARAREQARVPLAIHWICERCGEEWLAQSRKTTPLKAVCPGCGKRAGLRAALHDIEEDGDDGMGEGTA
jgi:hypothetical protein